MSRRTLLLSLGLVLLATLASGASGAGRHPAAEKAEQSFFNALNQDPRARTSARRDLMTALLADPEDARTNLLLGLSHLWLAVEGDKTNPLTIDHLILAEQFLARAQALDPSDRRIPSWLVPVRLSLMRLQGQEGRKEELLRDLLAAYAEDPNFHSFTVALLGVEADRSSPEFRRGLDALRAASAACQESGDPSCRNLPRWPRNQEGFTTFAADYELKAGHTQRARDLLLEVQGLQRHEEWKFRGEVEDRLKNLERYAALYANADPGDDPPHLMSLSGGSMCQACHLGP